MHKQLRLFAAALAFAAASPALAEVVAVSEETPTVTVDVPATFETNKTDRGLKAKSTDGAVWIWFETYAPEERDNVVKEHNEYWATNGVEPGSDVNKAEQTAGGKTVIATDYKSAAWKGKPTVLRYLFIDPALPTKKLVLMSLWASPEGDKAHDAEVTSIIESMKIKE